MKFAFSSSIPLATRSSRAPGMPWKGWAISAAKWKSRFKISICILSSTTWPQFRTSKEDCRGLGGTVHLPPAQFRAVWAPVMVEEQWGSRGGLWHWIAHHVPSTSLRPGEVGLCPNSRYHAGQFPQVSPLSPFSHRWVSGIVSSARPRKVRGLAKVYNSEAAVKIQSHLPINRPQVQTPALC